MKKIRVLLADDHTLVRKGFVRLLESDSSIEVVGEASDGLEALQLARELKPDVVLLDIYMPGCDGITATKIIRQELPTVRVIILTVSEKEQNLFAALKNGAQGYLIKKIGPRELTEMVKAATRGEACISPATAAKIIAEFSRQSTEPKSSSDDLTAREKEVLALVAQGLSNKEVADILALSEHTVRNHLRNILEKLHLRNRVEAATYALKAGLVPPPGKNEPE